MTSCAFITLLSFRINDVIVKVNDCDILGVPHQSAVDALKRAGNTVRMVSTII